MKNFLFAALLTFAFAGSAIADPVKVSAAALYNFKSEFKNATDVTWVVQKEYTKAAFVVNNQKMEAFYDLRGEMIALSKNITLDELPVNAKRVFAKRFEGFTVKEAIRFDGLDESAYYISAEDDNERVILKVSENDYVSVYKKTKK